MFATAEVQFTTSPLWDLKVPLMLLDTLNYVNIKWEYSSLDKIEDTELYMLDLVSRLVKEEVLREWNCTYRRRYLRFYVWIHIIILIFINIFSGYNLTHDWCTVNIVIVIIFFCSCTVPEEVLTEDPLLSEPRVQGNKDRISRLQTGSLAKTASIVYKLVKDIPLVKIIIDNSKNELAVVILAWLYPHKDNQFNQSKTSSFYYVHIYDIYISKKNYGNF